MVGSSYDATSRTVLPPRSARKMEQRSSPNASPSLRAIACRMSMKWSEVETSLRISMTARRCVRSRSSSATRAARRSVSAAAAAAADTERLAARVAELERERTHLLAVIEILKEVSTSLHFIDILQAIARKLGEAFGLDRCSIFLAERGGRTVRLVASYEDPTIRNYMVDLERYPELKRAMQSGETVFIPDAANDPSLRHV